MNELKNNLTQLWNALTLPQKASIVASVMVVVTVLGAVVYFSSQPKYSLLFANLPSEEASKVVEFLQTKKIPFELGDGGKNVMVPGNRVYELRLAMASAGIPRASDIAGGVGFELFDKATFGMSDFMQKANYYRALQGELARTIRQFDEIEEARVMIVVPEDRLFRKEARESKASVFVKLKHQRLLSEDKVQAIRFLVANGVENLMPERVAVVDNFGRALAEDRQNSSLLTVNANQIQVIRSVEDHLREKAQSMLDQVLGPGQSVVRVAAELDFDAVQETSEKFDPQSSVLRNESTSSENNKSETASKGGVTGTTPNTEQSSGSSSSTPTKSEQVRETVNNKYEINRVVETRQRASGTVRRVTVAVLINARKAAGAATTTARTPQELKQLEEVVKQAVGFTQNDARKDNIQMQETEFNDIFANVVQDTKTSKADVIQGISAWLPWVSQAFLVILAVAVFFYFKGMVQSSSKDTSGEFSDLLTRFEKIELNGSNGVTGTNGRNGHHHGLTMDDVTKLIRENPTNTTQAIKQWLTRN